MAAALASPAAVKVAPAPAPAPGSADAIAATALQLRQRTLQAQLALAAAQAPEELPLDGLGDDSDGEEDEEHEGADGSLQLRGGHAGLERLAADAQEDAEADPLVDSMFARPWSAHARSMPSARALNSRPQSAARGRLEQHQQWPEEEYTSFVLPMRNEPAAAAAVHTTPSGLAAPASASEALQSKLRGNVYAQAFAAAAAVPSQGSYMRGSPSVGQLLARSGHGAPAGSGAGVVHGGQTPRSSNPFLLRQ